MSSFFAWISHPVVIALIVLIPSVVRRLRRERRNAASLVDADARQMDSLRRSAWLTGVLTPVSYPLVIFAGLLFSVGVFGLFGFVGLPVVLLFAIIIGAALRHYSSSLLGQYNYRFKRDYILKALLGTFDNLQYRMHSVLDNEDIRRIGFFAGQNSMMGNDHIEADYNGKHFAQCDLLVTGPAASLKLGAVGKLPLRTGWTNTFRCRMMRFDLTEELPGDVQVVKWNFTAAAVLSSPGEWRTVETELPEFHNVFKVYAKDELTAMRLLTPQMIEGIFRLDAEVEQALALLFTKRRIYAFFPTGRDAFDVSEDARETFAEELEHIKKDIGVITTFLDGMSYGMRENVTLLNKLWEDGGTREGLSAASAGAHKNAEEAGGSGFSPLQSFKNMFKAIKNYQLKQSLLILWSNPPLLFLLVFYCVLLYQAFVLPGLFALEQAWNPGDGEVKSCYVGPELAYFAKTCFWVTIVTMFFSPGKKLRNGIVLCILAVMLTWHWSTLASYAY